MASILVRNIDNELKTAIRVQAAHNNRSMEEEVRSILKNIFKPKGKEPHLVDSIRELLKPIRGVDLEIPKRAPMNPPIEF